MLAELCPRIHARYSSLPLLGLHVDDFVVWLHARGYAPLLIRLRLRALPRVDARLRKRGARELGAVSRSELLALAPCDSQEDVYLAAAVRSLAGYLDERGLLSQAPATPREQLVAIYRRHLEHVRGLAASTAAHHATAAAEFLALISYDGDAAALRLVGAPEIESFLRTLGGRLSRASLQHAVAYLRSFLRFLAGRGEVAHGLDTTIDTPRLYRGERLPRALPWNTVQAFLRAIDRTTPMGRRDYAMFLLVATYGLRTSEVAALRLDDIEWRAGLLRVPRPKAQSPIVLPLTQEVGAALLDYLRHSRPCLPLREVFLRVRAPDGRLEPTAVTEAFQAWTRRGALAIPYKGPHCLRHSLAVHLLRQGTPLKAIGDLLGHRSAESTCVYLRLHVDDLRDTALDLPRDAQP